MSRGTVRGAFAGFLGLVALNAVATKGGSGRVAGAFGDVASLVERALSPNVPAIPDRRIPDPNAPGPSGKSKAEVAAEKAANGGTTPRLPIPEPPN